MSLFNIIRYSINTTFSRESLEKLPTEVLRKWRNAVYRDMLELMPKAADDWPIRMAVWTPYSINMLFRDPTMTDEFREWALLKLNKILEQHVDI